MYAVTKVIHFCYGHRLLNYAGKCRYLHGHNGKVEIELTSRRLDARGMVRDFEDVKRSIQRWIDTTLDHAMLLHRKDPLARVLRGERLILMAGNPTAERIAEMIFAYGVRAGFPVTSVRLWETPHSFATYRPAAGRRR
jgi:6-pyruvoyltetrahydropterin/6-carboxytetrahydropterin synthase